MDDRKIDYWDQEDAENLMNETLDEFIERQLNKYEAGQEPETIEAHGFARRIIKRDEMPDVLEDLLERLDEEYGGEDGGEETDAMRVAYEALLDVVAKEYAVWQCEPILKKVINVKDWRLGIR
jgi:phage terminase large subunit-like protein